MKRITVALTGGIGAGKSSAAEQFEKLGAQVVSGDKLGREVLDHDDNVKQALALRLGHDVLDSNENPNRSLIAARVFVDAELSKWLTAITFPGIYARWIETRKAATAQVIVFDAALIFEWNIQDEFNLVITVASSTETAYARASNRFSREDFLRRSAAQLPLANKIAGADCVIQNDGSSEQLIEQVNNIWSLNILPLIA